MQLPKSDVASSGRAAMLVLVLILLVGSCVRLVNLGEGGFTADALNHLYVAESLEKGEEPLLPSGARYERGLDISRLMTVAVDFVEQPETAARLPSALFGVLNLLLIAIVAWVIGGPWAAVWATGLLAMYPEAITQSRQTRFYTYQLVFGLLALLTGWMALRHAGDRRAPETGQVGRELAWGLLTMLLLLLGARVQVTTLSVAAGWGLCVLFAALLDVRARGLQRWRRSAPLHLFGLGFAGVSTFVLLRPEFLQQVRQALEHTAAWAEGYGSVLSYYYALHEAFPILVALGPLIFLGLGLRRPRLAGYLLLWFGVPVLLHSLLFAWKGERFIFLAVPALFVAAGLMAAYGCGLLYRTMVLRLREWEWPAARARLASAASIGTVALVAVATNPAHNAVLNAFEPQDERSWDSAVQIIEQIPGYEAIPIGSSVPISALYYWGRVDFGVSWHLLQVPTSNEESGGGSSMVMGQEGTLDRYTGVPVLTTPASIRGHFSDADTLLIGADAKRWSQGNVRSSLKEALQRDAIELCEGRCGDILLFLWPRSQSSADVAERTPQQNESSGGLRAGAAP